MIEILKSLLGFIYFSLFSSGFIVALQTIGYKTAGNNINFLSWEYSHNNYLFLLGDIAVGVIVLLIGIGFGVAAFGDFLLLVRVSDLICSSVWELVIPKYVL